MTLWCSTKPQFVSDERVVSLVFHPPEIYPKTTGTIVSPQMGSLYAVQLPDGELHRWFTCFELEPIRSSSNLMQQLNLGSLAKIVSTEAHPPHIQVGTIVRIVQVLDSVPFYDLMIDGHGYHRWLAQFELAPMNVVTF